ncbi:peptidoglycan DD-metalloendopeptidase family protein [SAR92 clade bacterium H231]|nr:peptidoglycan DD-metalloendopeptidase family protein [SAR92 clade bacterium H231]
MDARGNVISEELGNGVTRSATYEHNTGLLKNLQATLGAATFQNLELQWDQVGNLEQRKETGNSRNLTENFLYDGLNRLKSSQVVGSSAQTLTFNAIGNITHKSDVGSYSYGAGSAGPHAVTSAGGQTYSYDANGNNISGDGRTISYTSFDKPSQIIKGSHKVEFEYGPDRSRYRRTDTNSSNGRVTDTLYIGSVEKITNPDGSKEWKRTIGNVIIKHTFNSGGSQTGKSEHYLLKDHLGSPSLIMDKVAQVQQTLDFDPWGARRTTNWAAMGSTELTNTFFKNYSVSNSVGATALTSRGFTGHEMLDEVGIIHMNGRIYDAKLGRFLQADPIIQAPYNTQSLNRYSYVWNNPLNSTDPSGYFGFIGGFIIAKILIALDLDFLIPIVNIAGCLMGEVPGCIGTVAGTTYATTGDFGEAIKQGAIAGISAAAFQSVGEFFGEIASANATAVSNGVLQSAQVLENGLTFAQTVGKIATHAAVGGVMSVMQGGKFGHGFASAGFTQGLSGKIGGIGLNDTIGKFMRVSAAAVVGGTASKLTGGKFANGALTGAFSRLFNDEGHEKRSAQQKQKNNSPAWPTNHKEITSGFSTNRVDPVTGQTSRPHTAIDIKNPHGDPVFAIQDGKVVEVGSSPGAGNFIKIDHANGLQSSSSHTGSALTVGDTVTRGQTIGISDSSGRISGPHLHFVTRQNGVRVDPCGVLSCP